MSLEQVQKAADARLGMLSSLRHYSDTYIGLHYHSPMGVAVFSLYYCFRGGEWRYAGSSIDAVTCG